MAEVLVRLCGLGLDLQPLPRPFDFQAMAGETWLLVGAVSSGRRELIRTIAGLAVPRTGHVELFGQVVERMWPRARARLRSRIGVVLEHAGLVPAWSVFENLALLVRHHRLVPDKKVEAYVTTFVESCQLPLAILTRQASNLSPLESSWICLLRALIIKPRLLLVGAPLPRETLVSGYGVWTFFQEVVAPMRMTILVDAGPYALPISQETRLLVMDQGTVLAEGRTEDLAGHADAQVRRFACFGHV